MILTNRRLLKKMMKKRAIVMPVIAQNMSCSRLSCKPTKHYGPHINNCTLGINLQFCRLSELSWAREIQFFYLCNKLNEYSYEFPKKINIFDDWNDTKLRFFNLKHCMGKCTWARNLLWSLYVISWTNKQATRLQQVADPEGIWPGPHPVWL